MNYFLVIPNDVFILIVKEIKYIPQKYKKYISRIRKTPLLNFITTCKQINERFHKKCIKNYSNILLHASKNNNIKYFNKILGDALSQINSKNDALSLPMTERHEGYCQIFSKIEVTEKKSLGSLVCCNAIDNKRIDIFESISKLGCFIKEDAKLLFTRCIGRGTNYWKIFLDNVPYEESEILDFYNIIHCFSLEEFIFIISSIKNFKNQKQIYYHKLVTDVCYTQNTPILKYLWSDADIVSNINPNYKIYELFADIFPAYLNQDQCNEFPHDLLDLFYNNPRFDLSFGKHWVLKYIAGNIQELRYPPDDAIDQFIYHPRFRMDRKAMERIAKTLSKTSKLREKLYEYANQLVN